jgi:MFS family permease
MGSRPLGQRTAGGLGLALLAAAVVAAGDDTARAPAVAGQFYPAEAPFLEAAVRAFLQDAVAPRPERPVALVLPHAGYLFSGQIAADGYRQASGQAFDVVVILGTPHTVAPFEGAALQPGQGWRTPLGTAVIDHALGEALVAAEPAFRFDAAPHAREHSVEVQVPFVQVALPGARILPAVVGPAISGAIAERASWRWVFAGVVPLLAVAALLLLPQLRPLVVHRPAPPTSRVPAAVRLAVGTGLLLALPNFRAAGLLVQLGLAGLAGALLLPALRRLLPPGTLRARPGLPAGLALRGLLALSYFGTESFLPLSASELRGASPTRAGLALSAGALGWIAASWVQERLEVRGGFRVRSMQVGFVLVAVGIALVTSALVLPLPFFLIPLGWAVGGAGIGSAYTAVGLLCIALAPPEREGEVSAQLQLTESLGTALGAGAGGALLALSKPLGLTLQGANFIFFMGALLAALLGAALAHRLSSAGTAPAPSPQAPEEK